MSDSQAVLQALASGPLAQKEVVEHEIWHLLLLLQSLGHEVYLHFVYGHCGITENETADDLADAGVAAQRARPTRSVTFREALDVRPIPTRVEDNTDAHAPLAEDNDIFDADILALAHDHPADNELPETSPEPSLTIREFESPEVMVPIERLANAPIWEKDVKSHIERIVKERWLSLANTNTHRGELMGNAPSKHPKVCPITGLQISRDDEVQLGRYRTGASPAFGFLYNNVRKRPNLCRYCHPPDETTASDVVQQPITKTKSPSRTNVQCAHCPKTYQTSHRLAAHYAEAHPTLELQAEMVEYNKHNTVICSCTLHFATKQRLDQHLSKNPEHKALQHGGICPHCSKEFESAASRRSHELSCPLNPKRSRGLAAHDKVGDKCPYCTIKPFATKGNYYNHYTLKHADQPEPPELVKWRLETFAYCKCGQYFKTKKELSAHVKDQDSMVHGSVNAADLRCVSCSQNFESAALRRQHEATCPLAERREFRCLCGLVFTKGSGLDTHVSKAKKASDATHNYVDPSLITCRYCGLKCSTYRACAAHEAKACKKKGSTNTNNNTNTATHNTNDNDDEYAANAAFIDNWPGDADGADTEATAGPNANSSFQAAPGDGRPTEVEGSGNVAEPVEVETAAHFLSCEKLQEVSEKYRVRELRQRPNYYESLPFLLFMQEATGVEIRQARQLEVLRIIRVRTASTGEQRPTAAPHDEQERAPQVLGNGNSVSTAPTAPSASALQLMAALGLDPTDAARREDQCEDDEGYYYDNDYYDEWDEDADDYGDWDEENEYT